MRNPPPHDVMSCTILCPMVPPSANQLIRGHWSFEFKAMKAWERTIWGIVQGRDKTWLLSMAKLGKRMSVDILVRHNRVYDPDNMHAVCKPILDALVNNGFLAGDSPDKIVLHAHQEKIRAKETRIRICESGRQPDER